MVDLKGGRAVAIAAGVNHTCALMANGNVRCWGQNRYGQLGNGVDFQESSKTPVDVKNLTNAVAIATGDYYTCAVRFNGTVKCWGANDYGQLGYYGFNRNTPRQVENLTKVAAIAAGANHTCAVLTSGNVQCWGSNHYYQLGDGSYVYGRLLPDLPVSGLSYVTQIAAGAYHNCAVVADGTVWCWGFNSDGQLGDGTRITKTKPVPTAALVP